LALRQEPHDLTFSIDADRVGRNDDELVGQQTGDLVDDALQHGKPQREDDSIGALQHITVIDSDDRSPTDVRGQRSCRLMVGTRKPENLATPAACTNST
jgi:hypothetical protein